MASMTQNGRDIVFHVVHACMSKDVSAVIEHQGYFESGWYALLRLRRQSYLGRLSSHYPELPTTSTLE